MRTVTALIALILAFWSWTPVRAQTNAFDCSVPDNVLGSLNALPNFRSRLTSGKPAVVSIVTTAKGTSSRPETSFAARTEAELTARLGKGRQIPVVVRNLPGLSTEDMLAGLGDELKERKPSLVIWQTGTVDAMRAADVERFNQALEQGVSKTRQAGADIILMDMQYSLQTTQFIDFTPYVEDMAWVAQNMDTSLFSRYMIMRHWVENSVVDFEPKSRDERQRSTMFVNACLAKLLVERVAQAVDADVARAP